MKFLIVFGLGRSGTTIVNYSLGSQMRSEENLFFGEFNFLNNIHYLHKNSCNQEECLELLKNTMNKDFDGNWLPNKPSFFPFGKNIVEEKNVEDFLSSLVIPEEKNLNFQEYFLKIWENYKKVPLISFKSIWVNNEKELSIWKKAIKYFDPDIFKFVYTHRDIESIKDSRKRVGWHGNMTKFEKFYNLVSEEINELDKSHENLCIVSYEHLEKDIRKVKNKFKSLPFDWEEEDFKKSLGVLASYLPRDTIFHSKKIVELSFYEKGNSQPFGTKRINWKFDIKDFL